MEDKFEVTKEEWEQQKQVLGALIHANIELRKTIEGLEKDIKRFQWAIRNVVEGID